MEDKRSSKKRKSQKSKSDVPSQQRQEDSFRNKQKVLVCSTRAITVRSRHLMEDIRSLLPHSKKESKLEAKDMANTANDMCELAGCNKLLLFDTKHWEDLFVWAACAPQGPSVKFHLKNIHTMLELNFSGNHLKGSRPILSFDSGFENGEPHWILIKELLTQIFATPKGHKRSKPFVDHVITFSRLNNEIWMRNYQISPPEDPESEEKKLVEVGPRVVWVPVRVFEGSLRGVTLWKNSNFVQPNVERRKVQIEKDKALVASRAKTKKTKKRMETWSIPDNEYDSVMKHAGDLNLDDIVEFV